MKAEFASLLQRADAIFIDELRSNFDEISGKSWYDLTSQAFAVNCAREHFANKGVHVDTIQLYGSMELAPLVGMANALRFIRKRKKCRSGGTSVAFG